jgi:hypothetical protein
MNFINETVHPKAQQLYSMLERGVQYLQEDGTYAADHYATMHEWQRSHGMSDEKIADLYAMLAEKFEAVWTKMTKGVKLSGVSYCLWSNDRRYPR